VIIEEEDDGVGAMLDEDAARDAEESARAEEEKAKQEAKLKMARDVDSWIKKVDHWREHMKPAREQWALDRKLAAGDDDGEKQWEVNANLIGSICEVLLSFLYAKNPDIAARVADSAGRANIANYRKVAETLQIVVSRLLKDAMLKRKAKRWVRSAMTVGTGWLRAGMQTRTEIDPIMESRINDLRKNMEQYDAEKALLASGYCADQDVTRASMDAQLVAMQGQMEILIAEGGTLDVLKPEDVIVSPECAEIEDYFDAPWIAIDIYKPRADAVSLCTAFGDDAADILKSATTYMQRPRKGDSDGSAAPFVDMHVAPDAESESAEGFVRITEIWSKRDGGVRTYVEGIRDRWARETYAPRTWLQFYPLFLLTFNPVDGLRYAQSDVYRLRSLQEEYSRTRSNQALHRKRAIPGIIFDAGRVDVADIAKLNGSTHQEYVGIKPNTDGQIPLRDLFQPKVYNPIDPSLYDTSSIQRDMEQISGASEALQSAVSVEKTATEAKIQNAGFSTRTGARRDNMEDALSDLAVYFAQMALQIFDQATAVKYAGPEAIWIKMSPQEAMTFFAVEVEAGSTGKPNGGSDRDAWGVLMPLMQGLIQQIGALRAGGPQNEWMVTPLVNLLQETLNRMDDPADAEMFIPTPPPPQPMIDPLTGQPVIDPATGQPVMQPTMMPPMQAPPTAGAPPPGAPAGGPPVA